MIRLCPNCNRRILVESDVSDFEHQCNADIKAVDEEDILIIGNWEDYTGSATETNVLLQGSTNKFMGTQAGIEGEDLEDLSVRGKSKERFRQRKHLEFIKWNLKK